MRWINPIESIPFDPVTTRLFIMFMDRGIWFAKMTVQREIPKKEFSVQASHFEPWSVDKIGSVTDRELVRTFENGCFAMKGEEDYNDLTTIYQRRDTGITKIDFQEISVCLPACWSDVIENPEAELTTKKRRPAVFYKSTAEKQNARELLKWRSSSSEESVIVDADTVYRFGDECWQHDPRYGRTFRKMVRKSRFTVAARERCRTISGILKKHWDHPPIRWVSDCCRYASLMKDDNAAIIDLDHDSACIHWQFNGESRSFELNGFGAEGYLTELTRRLGLLSFSGDHFETLNHRLFEEQVSIGNLPGPETLNYCGIKGCSAEQIQKASEEASSIYWLALLEQVARLFPSDEALPEKLIILGDSPIATGELARAAQGLEWKVAIKWPNVTRPDDRPLYFSERGALRAAELFHRSPLSDYPVGNLWIRVTEHALITLGSLVLMILGNLLKRLLKRTHTAKSGTSSPGLRLPESRRKRKRPRLAFTQWLT